MKTFQIPTFYRSPIISKIKNARKLQDPKKKDFSPTVLDFGPVRFFIARHFGFCYGVENAIEIAYKALNENPDKRVFLLSQMIHNPDVNKDLLSRGARFLMDTDGNQLIPFGELNANDIVIIPAFGTTLAIEEQLKKIGIQPQLYNTTCPFVERVWNKSEKIGSEHYTVIIHGKPSHEETRATFSRSEKNAPSIVIKDIHEAEILGDYILGKRDLNTFYNAFKDRYSDGFKPDQDFERIGVINQTTMLAIETQAIADYLKSIMIQKYGEQNINKYFADTRDTLCYATNENQESTYGLLQHNADLAIVVGGYNSSNTSRLVELCEKKMPTYFISSESEIKSSKEIHHFDYHKQEKVATSNFLPDKAPVNIILTSGASCPDSIVDEILQKICSYFSPIKNIDEVLNKVI